MKISGFAVESTPGMRQELLYKSVLSSVKSYLVKRLGNFQPSDLSPVSRPNQNTVGFLELGVFSPHSFPLAVVVVGFNWSFLTGRPGNRTLAEKVPISARIRESKDEVLREKLADLLG